MKRKLEDGLDNGCPAKRPRAISPIRVSQESVRDPNLWKTLDLPLELQQKVFEGILDKQLARKLVSALSHLDSASAEKSAPYSLHDYAIGIKKLDALSERIFYQTVFSYGPEQDPHADENGVTLPSGRLKSVAGLLPLQGDSTKTSLVNKIAQNRDGFEQLKTLCVTLEHLEEFNSIDRDYLFDLTIYHVKSAHGINSHACTTAIKGLVKAEEKFSEKQKNRLNIMLNEDSALKDAYSCERNAYAAELKSSQSRGHEAMMPEHRPMLEECKIILDTADVISRQPMSTDADIVLNAKFVAGELERILIPRPAPQRLRATEKMHAPSTNSNRDALMSSERDRSYNER